MPGILDIFAPDDPAQKQGLLAATMALLQSGAPSRRPISTMEGIIGAQQAYGQSMDDYKKQELARQAAQQGLTMNGLKIKDAESDLKNQEMVREREARIRTRLMGAGVGGAMPQETQTAPAAPLGGSMMAGMGAQMPSWMPQQPAIAPQRAQPSMPQDLQAQTAQRLLQEAKIRSEEGDNDGANKLYEAATKLQPKYSTDFRTAQGVDGKLHNYVLADNGTWKDTGLGVKADVTEVDLGGTKQFIDKNTVTPGQVFKKTMTFADQQSAARLAFDKSQADSNQDEPMDPLAIRMTAQQYLAGDQGALQNFGRGAQGARNLNAVRLEIAKQATAAGLSGADIAAKMAEFGGIKAGQRTAGTRSASIEIAASEVAQLAPLALDASSKVARSGFKPFGNAQILFNSNTNDPAMRQFAMANTALVNAYGQAMARGGAATVSDKDHARELLSTAFDQTSYAAAVEQLQRETRAAQAAPKAVRRELSAEVSGRNDFGAHEVTSIPQEAKSFLKMNPKMRDQFDAKYGAGAAAAVLGK